MKIKRYKIKIYGIVQGVGYRPYIYNSAVKFNIYGWVGNQGSSVLMDIEGNIKDIKKFLNIIIKQPPNLAKIVRVEASIEKVMGYNNFSIKKSTDNRDDIKFISLDVGICKDCLNDISNPHNKRFNYPFTNCTNCGPRYSLIRNLPYDRENTAMSSFKMCTECDN